ncbi:MAG: response regulator [Acidobacteriota bacterium]
MSHSGPFVDTAILANIRRIGGDPLLNKIIRLFLDLAPEKIKAAYEGEKNGDLEAVERSVHSLRSSAATIGAPILYELCGTLERLSAENKRDQVAELLCALKESFQDVKMCLEKEKIDLSMKKIMVVEDNPDNRLLVRAILEERYEITECENGLQAIEALKQVTPDLVILDISLPGMDGLEVLSRIRADQNMKDLPVIALTAHAMVGDREKFLLDGFDDYVAKPILDENVLLSVIEQRLAESE